MATIYEEQAKVLKAFCDEKRLQILELLRGDYASRMTGYATARQNGWMSADDIRELENLDL